MRVSGLAIANYSASDAWKGIKKDGGNSQRQITGVGHHQAGIEQLSSACRVHAWVFQTKEQGGRTARLLRGTSGLVGGNTRQGWQAT